MANRPPIRKTPEGQSAPTASSSAADITAFLENAALTQPGKARGRLVFALDATMSRQPTWDRACHLQSEMFQEAGKIAGLQIKLVYFRGMGECRASRWFSDSAALAGAMAQIDCRGGHTQIRKVLAATLEAARKGGVSGLVYVGDCMEENVDLLCDRAGQLGLMGVPIFLFHEGHDLIAAQAFREMARLSKGAYCAFDEGSASQLGDLLRAVAAYASGGQDALKAMEKAGGKGARLLLEQLGR